MSGLRYFEPPAYAANIECPHVVGHLSSCRQNFQEVLDPEKGQPELLKTAKSLAQYDRAMADHKSVCFYSTHTFTMLCIEVYNMYQSIIRTDFGSEEIL